MARHRFYTHRHREGQSIPDFTVDLRRLASLCKFTEACRGEMLRDFFIEGIGHAGIFRKLIETKDMTLEAAALMVQTFMAGEEETKIIYARNSASNVAMDQGVNIVNATQNLAGGQGQFDTTQAATDSRVGPQQRQWQVERTFTPSRWTMRPGMGPLTPINRVLKSNQRDNQRGMPGNSPFVHSDLSSCWRCGSRHAAKTCRFQQFICRNCNFSGHLARMCRKPASRLIYEADEPEEGSARQVDAWNKAMDAEVQRVHVANIHSSYTKTPPMMMKVLLNGIPVRMELDTGASQSLMSVQQFKKLWPLRASRPKLECIDTQLRMYTKEIIPVLGSAMLVVTHNGSENRLPLWIVLGNGPAFIGRSWLAEMNWK
uniref:uncharacterized protein n=1 Tax=Pristiophorus japonicus TaxID=55135 RepID=UPI00398E6455